MSDTGWKYPRILEESDVQHENQFNVDHTGMRIHELALTNWCYSRFHVSQGVPIPVIISTPSEAFADFTSLWEKNQNGFNYLYQAKDSNGTPLYRPFPEPPKFPLITIKRDKWTHNPKRSFSLYWQRYAGWPSVASNKAYQTPGQQVDLPKADLGTVLQQRRPSGWDFSFQIDHYCSRPDTHAYFINQWMKAMTITSSQPQRWIDCAYPGLLGKRLVLLRQVGDISDLTEEEPGENKRIFRASINVILEGWYVDLDFLKIPAFWVQGLGYQAFTPPETVSEVYDQTVEDIRPEEANVIYDTATPMPTQ